MYPADYPAYVVQQVGLGVVNGSIGYQTNYCWGNTFDINASFENIETGENTDRNFVIPLTQTDMVKPNYTPLGTYFGQSAPVTLNIGTARANRITTP